MPTVKIGNNTGDDYIGVEDNRVDSNNDTYNNGIHPNGYTGDNGGGRTLREHARYNFVDIPAGATCDSAVMSIYDTNWANRTADLTITLYEIATANGNWVEGTTMNAAEVGSPCWGFKIYNSVAWAGSAGMSTAGTDYVNTSLGSAVFTDGVSGYRTITLNASGKTKLEDWFGDATNNGFILFGTGAGATWTEWQSRQGTDGQRPYLTVGYTAAGGNWGPLLALQNNRLIQVQN